MQNIATTVASKAIVAAVAAAMIFSAFAAPAKAQSVEDLQKMINDLMAQISALQGGSTTGGSSSSAAVCPFSWTRDLKTGATGADVMKLQQFLNANADTRVAATGAGSAGMETQTFGPATAAAVSKFQVMHRADILTPAGLTNPTGFFGPSTRAKANALCVAGATDEEEEEEGEDNGSEELSGEASLDDMTLESADEDEVEEGEVDAPIAEMTVNFQDGDASISRIDVAIDNGTSNDAWDILESVSLWVDGDMVAEMDASDEDDYLDEDDGSIRFSGLDIVAMEDEDLDIVIGATFQDGVENSDLVSYDVSVEAIRFFDAEGVATTEDTGLDFGLSNAVTFTLEEAGAEDELIAKTSANDPDATTLQVEDDSKSDWYTVFAFDLDTDDSVNDIELNTVVVNVQTTVAGYNTLVDDAELEIDGTTIDDVKVTGASTTAGTVQLTFDVDGDVTIDAGDRVEAKLMLKFKSLALANEGATVKGSISPLTTSIVKAEGADDLDASGQLSGSATGDAHTLRTTGVNVSLDSDSAVVTNGDQPGDDYATYKIVLDVTAFEQDVFISTNQATSVDATVVNSGGTAVSGTTTVVVDSSADVEGGSFKINEGETETVTITVTFDAATAGAAARLQLNDITFGATDGANNQTWLALPATDYRTDIVTLVN
jgi:hypothetical protein